MRRPPPLSQELKADFTAEDLLAGVKRLEIRDTNNPPATPPKPECLDEGGASSGTRIPHKKIAPVRRGPLLALSGFDFPFSFCIAGKSLPKHIQKRLGSCKLKQLRAKLERNRLTMPLFDTLRWVRDFERSLEAMWEIYASGHDPMNIVVFPTDPREYRTEG